MTEQTYESRDSLPRGAFHHTPDGWVATDAGEQRPSDQYAAFDVDPALASRPSLPDGGDVDPEDDDPQP